VRVLGDSPVAESLRQLAGPLGFDVATGGTPDQSDDAVVIASLGHDDEDAVERALASGAGYVALVASRRRGRSVIETLRSSGLEANQLERLHTPAGLDIGAHPRRDRARSWPSWCRSGLESEPRTAAGEAPAGLSIGVRHDRAGRAGWERIVVDGREVAFCGSGCRRGSRRSPSGCAAGLTAGGAVGRSTGPPRLSHRAPVGRRFIATRLCR
jgi:xanthine dehydrogenase accessory factor